ncbi:hypothetical protein MP478_02170 [Chryseobacterium sp. WG14]|uniref:hypothetical protein n=1 Tax=Chryseobacterium sp. WG14 TaxID=2926909 RepID=UPI00211DA6E7|nr:hypothetical protein [Chryseobacterium sp. WG14]MCQ9638179.1 hypothetical protein [Chryseobacterium sp. WG14]
MSCYNKASRKVRFLHSKVIDLYSKQNSNTEMFLNLLLGGYKNIYQYIDQLGNVRVSYGRNSIGVLESTDANDYYPFGMNHLKPGISYFAQGSYKSNKYNGKELQETGMYSSAGENICRILPDGMV